MLKDLKSIFKNKVIIFMLLFLITIYFFNVYNLKSISLSTEEYQYWVLEDIAKEMSQWKSHNYNKARIQDTTDDKHLYNNYIGTQEMISSNVNELMEKLRNKEKIKSEEFDRVFILKTLIHTEHFAGLYGKDHVTPTKAIPKKIEKFLEDINFEYNIYDINFLRKSDEPVPFKDRVAYDIKILESEIDTYFNKKTHPKALEYSIYNFIRSINYDSPNNSGIYGIHWMETFSIGVLPLLVFYLINEQQKNGTIKNIYLRPKSKYKNFLYFLSIFLIVSLIIVYLPKFISSVYVLVTGENYDANTNVIVIKKVLNSFQTTYENEWSARFKPFGLTNCKFGKTGDLIEYTDLIEISFSKFLSYYLTIDILKILLVVLTATSISLFLKNKIIAFGLNAVMGIMLILGGKINSNFFTNKFNPFILPNGWKLTIGREYISYYNALIILIVWIIVLFALSILIANRKDIE